jgi:hypothetical protein
MLIRHRSHRSALALSQKHARTTHGVLEPAELELPGNLRIVYRQDDEQNLITKTVNLPKIEHEERELG